MFTTILYSTTVIGALGLIFGLLLALASKFFAVEGDPKLLKIRQALPGANCGACGYPGCDAFASAVLSGEAQINGCPVCTPETIEILGIIMDVHVDSVEPLVAVVRCKGSNTNAAIKYNYDGIKDCTAAAALAGGYKECDFSCMGMGNCARVCPTDAITIEDGLASIDQSRCITCGKCAAACPRSIIGLLPVSSSAIIRCRSTHRGTDVRDACNVGCIGCGICAKVCPNDAIEIINDLPIIDYDKCVDCGICADKCPRNCISFDIARKRTAFIDESKCIGCTLCIKACKFDAVEGVLKGIHKIDPEKCVGCGACIDACKKKAIYMISRK